MNKGSYLKRVFTGRQVIVSILKEILEENGIISIIQNDYQSSAMAGFYGGTPSAIDILIKEEDVVRATPIITDFIQQNK
jgi:hypothetical protein